MRTERTNAHKAGQFNLITWIQLAFAVAAVVLIVFAVNMAWGDIPRLSDGKPDLSGYYDTATITPMQPGRPRRGIPVRGTGRTECRGKRALAGQGVGRQ